MQVLSEEQVRHAVRAMKAYLAAPRTANGPTRFEHYRQKDQMRASVIDSELMPLLREYLKGAGRLADFKSDVDSINKRNHLWGFKGPKGQMFFNMMVKVAKDEAECDREIKAAIRMPHNDRMASTQIDNLFRYGTKIAQQHTDSGGSLSGRPKLGSIPFFLSYFWQIQDRAVWPVYYTNSVNKMIDFDLWHPTGDLAADYGSYKSVQEELADAFSKGSGLTFGLYDVERVFWFHGENPVGGESPRMKLV